MARAVTFRGGTSLVLALARGETVADAAQGAGLSRRTVYRYLEHATFRRRVDAARAELVAAASAQLAAAATDAVATLRELLGAQHNEFARLGAARGIIEVGLKLREGVDLEARVAALEAAASPDPGGGLRRIG